MNRDGRMFGQGGNRSASGVMLKLEAVLRSWFGVIGYAGGVLRAEVERRASRDEGGRKLEFRNVNLEKVKERGN